MGFRAVIFDVDGVLTTHGVSFSKTYAQKLNKDYRPFRDFFQGEFQKTLIGKADLKQLILDHDFVWETKGNVDGLLKKWFEAEYQPNESLLNFVPELRAAGVYCYIATNQERYRGAYIKNVMFPEQFDGYFVSALVGRKKPDPDFFTSIIKLIQKDIPGIDTKEILFIDDSQENVEGARQVGLESLLYTDLESVKGDLQSCL